MKLRNLISERMDLDVHTAEGQADNARFNYWVSVCLVYNDSKKPVFSSLEDYLNNSDKDYASEGASKMAELVYNLNSDFENSLEENEFLREFGLVDDKNRLIDNQGRLVDRTGRLVNEEGYYINESGDRVDFDGNLLDENGQYKVERKPFLDDDGNPVESKGVVQSSFSTTPKENVEVNEEEDVELISGQ